MAQDDINKAAMERYRRAITIELSSDDALHVTLNGVHSVNDVECLALALYQLMVRNKFTREVLPPPPSGVSYREYFDGVVARLTQKVEDIS